MNSQFYRYVKFFVFTSFIYLLIFENPLDVNSFLINKLNITSDTLLKAKILIFVSLYLLFCIMHVITKDNIPLFFNNIIQYIKYKSKVYISTMFVTIISALVLGTLIVRNNEYLFSLTTDSFEFYFWIISILLWVIITILFIFYDMNKKKNYLENITKNLILPILNEYNSTHLGATFSFVDLSEESQKNFINIISKGINYISNDMEFFNVLYEMNQYYYRRYINPDVNNPVKDRDIDNAYHKVINEAKSRREYIFGKK